MTSATWAKKADANPCQHCAPPTRRPRLFKDVIREMPVSRMCASDAKARPSRMSSCGPKLAHTSAFVSNVSSKEERHDNALSRPSLSQSESPGFLVVCKVTPQESGMASRPHGELAADEG